MSCLSCERSPIHARWHVFQAKSIGVMLSTPSTTLFCLALGSPTSARDCTACVRVENMTITVSTDGSALGNPNGPMGWAWADHEQNAGGKPGHKHDDHGYDAGGATNGTNQIGELCAVLEALRAHPGPEPLLIESDSQYAINCSTKWVKGWKKNGWKNSQKKPVKNKELIQAIDREISQRPGPVDFRWVKGHAGNEGNELVDELARTYAGDCRSGARDGYLPIEVQTMIADGMGIRTWHRCASRRAVGAGWQGGCGKFAQAGCGDGFDGCHKARDQVFVTLSGTINATCTISAPRTPRKAQWADGIRYADLLPRAENEPVFQRAADADQRQHRNRRLCGRRRQPDHHQRTIRTTLTPKHTNMYRNRTR